MPHFNHTSEPGLPAGRHHIEEPIVLDQDHADSNYRNTPRDLQEISYNPKTSPTTQHPDEVFKYRATVLKLENLLISSRLVKSLMSEINLAHTRYRERQQALGGRGNTPQQM
ncbi:hypothetical protein ACXM5X_18975 [Pseudomonas saponiphila]